MGNPHSTCNSGCSTMSYCGCGQQCGGQCCQQTCVQPVVQPIVAAQPRPSIAYSYGYPSTVTYGLSLPTVSPTYTWGGYPGLYGAGFLGGKAGAYGDINTPAAPCSGAPAPLPAMAPYGPGYGPQGPGYAPQAPGYAPGMGMGLPGVGFGSYGGYGLGGYGGVKADGGFLMSAVKK